MTPPFGFRSKTTKHLITSQTNEELSELFPKRDATGINIRLLHKKQTIPLNVGRSVFSLIKNRFDCFNSQRLRKF